MKKLYFFLSLIGMFTFSVGNAQQKTVSGTVLDDLGGLNWWRFTNYKNILGCKLNQLPTKFYKTTHKGWFFYTIPPTASNWFSSNGFSALISWKEIKSERSLT